MKRELAKECANNISIDTGGGMLLIVAANLVDMLKQRIFERWLLWIFSHDFWMAYSRINTFIP